MAKTKPALEFKGRMLSLTRVRVLEADLDAIAAQLKNFTRQMGQAGEGLPVILDSDHAIDLGGILAAMKQAGIQPIAAVDGPLAESARNWGLAVLPPDLISDTASRPAAAAAAPAPPAAAARKPARFVTEPVRSGQQIYAEGSDLIVTATVSTGAEVIADGCVHVYAALRGRAIAGARGDTSARVFCRRMEADLLAVAGVYAVADQMQGALRGQPVQAYLAEGKLKIERLEW